MTNEIPKSKDANNSEINEVKTRVKTDKPKHKRGGRLQPHMRFKLDEVDHKLLKQLMEFPDTTQTELAKLISYSPSGLARRISRPAFQNALKDIHSKTMDIFINAQRLAARRLMKLIQSQDESIALRAVSMALAPLVNQATLNVNTSSEKVYRVRFGDQGQMYQEVLDVEAEPEYKPTSMDLLKDAGIASKANG